MGKEEGVRTARSDINFMFKAFETGQVCFCVLRQHLAFPTLLANITSCCKLAGHLVEAVSK